MAPGHACLKHVLPTRRQAERADAALALLHAAGRHAQGPDNSELIRQWWADRADEAVAAMLRLDAHHLQGTSITSQTGRALRLRPSRFQRIRRISADGRHFPTAVDEFLQEVLRQAEELYGGRASLEMDTERLRRGVHACPDNLPRDEPDFRTTMLHLLGAEAVAHAIDAPVTEDELRRCLSSGSAATALDELPRPVLCRLPGFGVQAATIMLARPAVGARSELLHTALHIPLKKKSPDWLLRNSRPVLLQPFLRRVEATVVYRRMQHFLEWRGRIPSAMFAYRPQLQPQLAGLLLRWLLVEWAGAGHAVCVADWDEANAFCNVPRGSLPLLLDDLCPGVGRWLQRFYSALSVRTVTPHGLTEAYGMPHGGGQGDSGGVGSYLAVGIQRTRYHSGVVCGGLDPRTALLAMAPRVDDLLPLPFGARPPLVEVGYSDDRRPLARTDAGLARVVDALCHGCWAAGGSPNADKLKATSW